jgi:hypothetical protein
MLFNEREREKKNFHVRLNITNIKSIYTEFQGRLFQFFSVRGKQAQDQNQRWSEIRTVLKTQATILLSLLFLTLQPSAGYGLLVTRGFLITHNDAPQSVGLLLDEWSARRRDLYLTTHTKQTNIHAPGGFRTHDRSSRAAVDLRLRPRYRWDRHTTSLYSINRNIRREMYLLIYLFFYLHRETEGESSCNL